MNIQEQIAVFIAGQPEQKRNDIKELHRQILERSPNTRLWFDEGKNAENKTVSNPTIGYGFQTMKYADGKTRDFFQIGISTNTTGISVYILGIKDKKYLIDTYANKIGKASVTGYCIKFKTLSAINTDILLAAIKDGFEGNR